MEANALAGLPGGGLNLAYEAVDRHAQGARRRHTALRILDRNGGSCDISYAQLSILTNRFANVLQKLGVMPGDRLFVLCGRGLELYLGVLGGLKLGCVVSPLFCAFGPEPIETRMRLGEGSVLLTSETLYRRKVAAIRERLPALKHVLLYDENGGDTAQIEGRSICINCWRRQRKPSPLPIRPPTAPHFYTSPAARQALRKACCMPMARR